MKAKETQLEQLHYDLSNEIHDMLKVFCDKNATKVTQDGDVVSAYDPRMALAVMREAREWLKQNSITGVATEGSSLKGIAETLAQIGATSKVNEAKQLTPPKHLN